MFCPWVTWASERRFRSVTAWTICPRRRRWSRSPRRGARTVRWRASTCGSHLTTDLEQANPPSPEPHPVRLRATDELARNRLTVFFRIFLAIPHLIWLGLWGIGAFFLSIVNWVATLIRGQTPDGLYRFYAQFITYATHVYAYVWIAADRYPGFLGDSGYEVDLEWD